MKESETERQEIDINDKLLMKFVNQKAAMWYKTQVQQDII
jgi:hypothetical protein